MIERILMAVGMAFMIMGIAGLINAKQRYNDLMKHDFDKSWNEIKNHTDITPRKGEAIMENDILVVRVNMFLNNKELEAVRQYVLAQRATGVVVLPPYCDAIVVPKDVEIKFEKSYEHEEDKDE